MSHVKLSHLSQVEDDATYVAFFRTIFDPDFRPHSRQSKGCRLAQPNQAPRAPVRVVPELAHLGFQLRRLLQHMGDYSACPSECSRPSPSRCERRAEHISARPGLVWQLDAAHALYRRSIRTVARCAPCTCSSRVPSARIQQCRCEQPIATRPSAGRGRRRQSQTKHRRCSRERC